MLKNKNDLSVIWDQTLIEKYNYSGPRYTSYPTALEFSETFNENDFLNAANRYPDKTLSLYIHIPFCHKLCYFCGCNKIVTRNRNKVDIYLAALKKEIKSRSKLFKNRIITQMHWGGGTPTFLTDDEITWLMAQLKKYFNFSNNAELSIEIDPREISPNTISHLAKEGFNRLSMGVQDFNKEIQTIVNREQDEELITSLVKKAKDNNFKSISLDLIYGLPKQTVDNFLHTLNKIVALDPDRLSIFNYAHLPSRFAAQRKIKDDDLPSAQEKVKILEHSIQFLTQHRYHFIGMDHFAKPTDELAISQKNGTLHRNFQGYTTQGEADLLGLGVSAISMIGDCYSQNQKVLKLYQQQVDEYDHALWKGITMSKDDVIRRDVIKQLICHFYLDKPVIEKTHNIKFDEYFESDLSLLMPLAKDNLVEMKEDFIQVNPKGRLLIRNICMCFDIYMRRIARQQQFSRVL